MGGNLQHQRINLLKTETGLLQSDHDLCLQIALLRKNYVRKRPVTPLQYWIWNGRWRKESFEQDSQIREDFERGKSLDEFEQSDWLRLKEPFRPINAFQQLQPLLQGRNPHLPYAARIRNTAFRHPAINCRGKLKALNTGL